MKNKLSLIDINIVSAYMGRFLTVIVTLLVIAVTLSALFSNGGIRDHLPLVMEIPGTAAESPERDRFEPLRYLLARETGRNVTTVLRGQAWNETCEVYVLSVEKFMEERTRRELMPLYSVERMERLRDAAILVSRSNENRPVLTGTGEVMFAGPGSINGCWVQLAFMESSGIEVPERLESLRFPQPPGGSFRPIFAVLFGEARLGACRLSDLRELIGRGDVDESALTIVNSIPALPETVIACHPEDAGYIQSVLRQIATTMAAPGPAGRDRDAVDLLKSRGIRNLRPVTRTELERLAELFDYIGEKSRNR